MLAMQWDKLEDKEVGRNVNYIGWADNMVIIAIIIIIANHNKALQSCKKI